MWASGFPEALGDATAGWSLGASGPFLTGPPLQRITARWLQIARALSSRFGATYTCLALWVSKEGRKREGI